MNERDPEFAAKAVAILDVLFQPPTDGPLFCVDEKTAIAVRMPKAPDQPVRPGRRARREFEYVRHGTVDLLAAFGVQDGHITGLVRPRHRSAEFCELLAQLDTATPPGQCIHLILDNISLHRSAAVSAWLADHPKRPFVFHWLPLHSSWLSFIEVWFSILSRKCLKHAAFATPEAATEQITAFIATYNRHVAHPFAWKKGVRFYQRLKDKLAHRDTASQESAA